MRGPLPSFAYDALAGRVVFGVGAVEHLGEEVDRLGGRRVLAIAGKRAVDGLVERLGGRWAASFTDVQQHVPVEAAARAVAAAAEAGADCLVAMGGGSATGMAKAVALEHPAPILAVPTTYAGSEMTPIYGITEGGLKKTGRDARVLPKTVIYDPTLTVGLPVGLSVTSGMNAIAHAVEGLYAQDTNPIMSMLAEEGIHSLSHGLQYVVKNPRDLNARSECLYGAWLCGAVLGAVGMALHHKLCHTLGGTWNLPHAETHTVVLPHAVAYNREAAAEELKRAARALHTRDAAQALYDLARTLGAPLALKDIGMKEADLDRAADLAAAAPYWNPRPVERAAIRELLERAFTGARPL